MIGTEDQNDIGKEVIAQLGALPGYGSLTWWDGSGTQPLDGATSEWAIDVKTVNKNDPDHRYDPGNKRNYPRATESKNELARKMEVRGILGVLVILDYRNNIAAIHAKEMPLHPHMFGDTMKEGAYSWRKYDAPKLIENVPFKNPLHDPKSHLPQNVAE